MSPSPLITVEQLGKQVKSKYPVYASKSDTEVGQAVLKKYPVYQSRVQPAAPKLQPEARTVGNYLKEGAYGVGRGLKNDVQGLAQMGTHPISTLVGMRDQSKEALVRARKAYQDAEGSPEGRRLGVAALAELENSPVIGGMVQKAEQGGEEMGSPEAFGAAAEGITTFAAPDLAGKGIGKLVKNAPDLARSATGTGPNVAADLAKKTGAENLKTAESNKVLGQEHLDKTRDALHETEGRELQHGQAVRAATDEAAEKQRKLDSDHAKEVADTAAKRKIDLKKHFDKTRAAKEENTQAAAGPERKAALNRGIEQLDVKFQDDLKATEKSVRAEAGGKYDAVRAATQGQILPPAELQSAVRQAQGMIQGSAENIKLFNDILSKAPIDYVMSGGAKFGPGSPLYESVKATPEGLPNPSAPVTFSDLQGYYSELGEKLSGGNLPGDVYQALKSLQESINGKMQQMADNAGVGSQLGEARNFYSQYMKAFRDHDSPLYKARNATERGRAIANLSGKDQTGVETLARYNPDLARRANTIRGYQSEAKSIPAKPRALKSLPRMTDKPPLPPAPPRVQAKMPSPPERVSPPDRPQYEATKKVEEQDIRKAKAESLYGRAEAIRNRGGGLASTFAVMAAIRSAMHGDVMGIGEDIAVRAAFGAGKTGLANLLESKPVVEWLTKATPVDVAKIPPDMRGNLGAVVQAAQKKGINVSPALLTTAAVTGQSRKGVAAAMQP